MDGPPGSRPTRRGLLGIIGAVTLSGCSGADERRAGGDGTLTAVPLPEATETPRDRRVLGPSLTTDGGYDEPWYDRTSTAGLSPSGRTVAFHPRPTGLPGIEGGGGFGRPGTPKAPARLLLTLVNTGDRTVQVHHDTVPGRLRTPQGDARAYLLPDPAEDHREMRDRVWFDGEWRGRPSGQSAGTVTVPPEEFRTLEYVLVAGPEGPPFPVGTYAFVTGFGWEFTLGVWRTDAPGPDGRSHFADETIPDLPTSAPTRWFHRADRTTEVYLRPAAERITLADDGTTLPVALFNHSATTLVGNPSEHELLKLHDGTWYHVAPAAVEPDEGHLPRGASVETRFELHHGRPDGDRPSWKRDDVSDDDADLVPVGHLGGGRYAIRFGMGRPGRSERHAALLDVTAPSVELSPDPELRVSDPASTRPVGWLDPSGGLFDAFVTVTRTDTTADRTVIAEQVMQDRVLRNTIPLFGEGTEIVELHTRDPVADRLLEPRATLRLSFRGTTYEVVRRDD
jgi:hypothetical protein